jgi:LysM repeat protein
MRRRSPARWLAPLALVIAAVAIYAVVHNELSSSSDDGAAATTSSSTTATTKTKTTAAKKAAVVKHRVYTVKAGDVLSAIAAANGTTVTELQRLNPGIDAGALHPGQKLKLSR